MIPQNPVHKVLIELRSPSQEIHLGIPKHRETEKETETETETKKEGDMCPWETCAHGRQVYVQTHARTHGHTAP